jgi:hypothetical protein
VFRCLNNFPADEIGSKRFILPLLTLVAAGALAGGAYSYHHSSDTFFRMKRERDEAAQANVLAELRANRR